MRVAVSESGERSVTNTVTLLSQKCWLNLAHNSLEVEKKVCVACSLFYVEWRRKA